MAKLDYDDRYVLSSLNNALKILELLMVRDNITLKEISDIVGLNRTTTYKMLYTLERREFITKNKRKYSLGNKMQQYGAIAKKRQDLSKTSYPHMLKLWINTNQTVCLCVLNTSGKVVFVSAKLKSSGTTSGRIGGEMEWYTNSAGKVLLAHSPVDVQKAILSNTIYKKFIENTITDVNELQEQLNSYRRELVVTTQQENNNSHSDIAAPIFNDEGTCIGCIMIVLELSTIDSDLKYYQRQVKNTAIQISKEMGYSGY